MRVFKDTMTQDEEFRYYEGLGISGSLNDKMYKYLRGNGYEGSLGDMLYKNDFLPADLPGLTSWYDPSDISTLFQDTEGTTPVTASGDPVALVLDKSGNGNHATQSVSGNRPAYQTDGTVSYLEFDGVGDHLVFPTQLVKEGFISYSDAVKPTNALFGLALDFIHILTNNSVSLDGQSGEVGGLAVNLADYTPAGLDQQNVTLPGGTPDLLNNSTPNVLSLKAQTVWGLDSLASLETAVTYYGDYRFYGSCLFSSYTSEAERGLVVQHLASRSNLSL